MTHKNLLRGLVCALFALELSGCGLISRRIDVPPFIPPTRNAGLSELIEMINEMSTLTSLTAKVDLQFLTVENQEKGESRRYRTAEGRILLTRPRNIRLQIEAPVLSAPIADLASDGEHFQLLIYPSRYRALIEGENDQKYEEEAQRLRSDDKLRQAGPLVNIRPQHFTDAFLRQGITSTDIAVFNETRVTEEEMDPRSRKKRDVERSYYVVTVIRPGEASPRTQYWFDRTKDLVLSRQQVFDRDGLLVGIVRFSRYLPPHETTGQRFASQVLIERPYEKYTLKVNLKPDTIVVDRDLPETAFVLTAPEEWGESLRHIKLGEPPPENSR